MAHIHKRVTGLSGNEIYCLDGLGLQPGTLCIGNSVFSLGFFGTLSSGLKTLAGGEIEGITSLIHEGRQSAFNRMYGEAKKNGGAGVTGVSTELIIHSSNIEFLTIGSAVHSPDERKFSQNFFSSAADAQELFCQVDAGFHPLQHVFGNVAYSIGVGGGLSGAFRSLGRGEVPEFTEIFDNTRHLALSRITDEAKKYAANAVLGIETTITPIMGAQEMVMVGTSATHPALGDYFDNPVTSDMTNEEMWNMIRIGFMPVRLVMGVSVFSLGLAGGIRSTIQAFSRGEINELTTLLYEARELSLDRIQRDADRWGADEVVGVKTNIYELGGGLLEFLAIGTAVKRMPGLNTKSVQIPPQAITRDRDTYFESGQGGRSVQLGNRPESGRSVRPAQFGPLGMIFTVVVFALYIYISFKRH